MCLNKRKRQKSQNFIQYIGLHKYLWPVKYKKDMQQLGKITTNKCDIKNSAKNLVPNMF